MSNNLISIDKFQMEANMTDIKIKNGRIFIYSNYTNNSCLFFVEQ